MMLWLGFWLVYAAGMAAILTAKLRLPRWYRAAHRMAQRQDIALPPELEPRVARFLRRRYAFSMLVSLVSIPLCELIFFHMDSVGDPRRAAPAYAAIVFALPFVSLLLGLGAVPVRLPTSQPQRMSHLVRPSPLTVFTRTEWLANLGGVVLTIGTAAWSLWRIGAAPFAPVYLAAIALIALLWWRAITSIMNRRSSASDIIELGWDDVIRYSDARNLTAGLAWGPGGIMFMMDLEIATPGNLIGFYVVAGVGVLLASVFRQGRHLWRESWNSPAAS